MIDNVSDTLTDKKKLGYTSILKQGVLISFIMFLLVFSLFSSEFAQTSNILTVFRQASVIGIIAIGVTFVVMTGNLDLSVGSMLSFGAVLIVDLHDKLGPIQAVICTVMALLILGSINGYLIAYKKLNSLIVTLGMLSVIQGVTLIYTDGKNVDISSDDTMLFDFIGRGSVWDISVPIIIFIVLGLIAEVLLKRTVFGRKVTAIGGNETTVIYSGVDSAKTVFLTYLLSSFSTACAALIVGSRVMGAQNNVGQGYELLVLAGIILGGTSLLGGSGNITRTILGVLILSFLQNGLLLLGFPYYIQWVVTWSVIILAVWLDIVVTRRKLFVD
ncbi:ABC transporter permease [Vibrio crassostreae]|uniref:ABC transporter permease n=1 Tax=Vibrio crassostreae TaxID=246167 RepID=UPI001B3014AA|nr:ABC transporter permease [Vibrio crassostreae]